MAQKTRKITKEKEGNYSSKKKGFSSELFFHNLEQSFEKNQKAIISIVVVIALAVGGFFGYKYLFQLPKEKKAATALSYVQEWFSVDSFNLVLNGNGLNMGAIGLIKQYDGTNSANLAHYYAGISYLNTNAPENAIKQLLKFDGKGTPSEFLAYGTLGDAYMESKNVDKGIAYYEKAASDKKNKFIAPLYLFRAGLACELNGKKEDAIKFYKEIKSEYPYSKQGQTIGKYLARVGDVSL